MRAGMQDRCVMPHVLNGDSGNGGEDLSILWGLMMW